VDIRLILGWGGGFKKREREKKNKRERKDREA
jgi:hypothetical protein